MRGRELDVATGLEEPVESERRAGSPTYSSGHGGAGDAEFREGADAEDEKRPEDDVDAVREPEYAHRDRRIAGPAKDAVDEKEHDHARVSTDHHAGEVRAGRDDLVIRAEQPQQVWREHDSDDPQRDRHERAERQRLNRGTRRPLGISLPDAAGDRGGRSNREAYGERVDDR